MPYVSQAQAGYFHTHEKELKKQGVDVGEWDAATKGKHLPKRAKKFTYGRSGDAADGKDSSSEPKKKFVYTKKD
jgi:hypothetical protein